MRCAHPPQCSALLGGVDHGEDNGIFEAGDGRSFGGDSSVCTGFCTLRDWRDRGEVDVNNLSKEQQVTVPKQW